MNQNVFIRRACMSLMFSMLCLLSLAQTHQVSGIVKDVTGEPVIGVNVSVQGTLFPGTARQYSDIPVLQH